MNMTHRAACVAGLAALWSAQTMALPFTPNSVNFIDRPGIGTGGSSLAVEFHDDDEMSLIQGIITGVTTDTNGDITGIDVDYSVTNNGDFLWRRAVLTLEFSDASDGQDSGAGNRFITDDHDLLAEFDGFDVPTVDLGQVAAGQTVTGSLHFLALSPIDDASALGADLLGVVGGPGDIFFNHSESGGISNFGQSLGSDSSATPFLFESIGDEFSSVSVFVPTPATLALLLPGVMLIRRR